MTSGALPRLTVVIATYNRAPYLDLALRSVLSQDFDDFRLVVVDDASTDDTPAVVEGMADPRITYHRQEHNLGWLANCNAGVRTIDTEYGLLLGDDDVMTAGALGRAVAALDRHPSAGIAHAAIDLIDGGGATLVERTNWTGTLDADALETGEQFIEATFRHGGRVCSSTVMMRMAMIPDPAFDPADGPVSDISLQLRVAARHDIAFVGTPGARYRIHAGSDSARWSRPNATGYEQSLRLILRTWRMERRFLRTHAADLADARHLRRIADATAARHVVAHATAPLRWRLRNLSRSRLGARPTDDDPPESSAS